MADHGPTIRGYSMMVSVYEQRMKARKLESFFVKVDEVVDLGEFCWAMGTYVIEVAPPEGSKEGVTLEGTYLTIFRRQSDGSLKVYRDTMMNGTSELM